LVFASIIAASGMADDPQVFSIRTGTARQQDQLIPSAQFWCRSAQAWAMNLSDMKRFPEEPLAQP
jgi:hypothetical protein